MSSFEASPATAASTAPVTLPEDHGPTPSRIVQEWSDSLTAQEWDRRFPGVLDGIVLLGGVANIIMQLASLPVGHGVAESRVESGAVFKRPAKRARTTFSYLSVAMMGTSEEKRIFRSAVNRAHAQVHSDSNSTVQYNAFDPQLQLWVAACLYWGYAEGIRLFRGEMTRAQKEELYRLAEPLATTLQVRSDMWPKDLAAFEEYWQQGLADLHVDDKVRDFLNKLVDLRFLHPLISKTAGPFIRFVTTGILPPEVRAKMDYEWSDEQQRRFVRLLAVLGGVNRLLPRAIRQLPFTSMLWDFRRRVRKGLPLV